MSKLHADLVAIRKSQKLSVQDMHDKTRLAMNTIQQIEDGSIFEAESNKTYTRSYVRTYARGLGMEDSDMIQALDLREGGMYDGFLVQKYTGEKPAEPAPPAAESKPAPPTPPPAQKKAADPDEADPSDAKAIPTPGKETPDPVQPEPSTKTEDVPKSDAASTESKPRVLDGSTIGPGKTGPVKIRNAQHTPPPPPTSADVDWSDLRRNTKRPGKDIPVLPIAGGIIILLLLAAGIFWLINSDGEPADTTGLTPENGVTEERAAPPGSEFDEMLADTLDAPVPPDPSRAAAAALPDTLHVVVYAATGNLEPFRVRSDTFENRRPYWIEQGVGMRISFVNEMTLTGNFNRMLVLYDNRVITEFDEIDENGERILRRSQFEDDPSLGSFTEAGLPAGISEPREVIERPIIN
ncbi:MAG: helix-turn-helix domain-containing protein [Balneolia bacterium]|nr:helix-turn-helix domain-containing protein [Balneolia bacterium]